MTNISINENKSKELIKNYQQLLDISLRYGNCISSVSYNTIFFGCNHRKPIDEHAAETNEDCPLSNNIIYPKSIKKVNFNS